jgi:hypothetical protein
MKTNAAIKSTETIPLPMMAARNQKSFPIRVNYGLARIVPIHAHAERYSISDHQCGPGALPSLGARGRS